MSYVIETMIETMIETSEKANRAKLPIMMSLLRLEEENARPHLLRRREEREQGGRKGAEEVAKIVIRYRREDDLHVCESLIFPSHFLCPTM